jgi:hypothetical protein
MLHLKGCSMSLEKLYPVIFLLGGLAEFALLGVLVARRRYNSFPVFTAYIAFNVLADIVLGLLASQSPKATASWAALGLLAPQYLLEIGVLLEIAWHVLRPVHPSLPAKALNTFASLVVLALVSGLLLAWHVDVHAVGIYQRVKFPLDLTVGLLRMLLFAAIAAFAQVLGINWKHRVLQLATGLSFYSAIDLVASLIQSHSGQAETASHLKGAAYLLELGFFIWAFTTKEVERREFTPQMREFLVTIAGRAQNTRAAIVSTQVK